MHLSPYPVIVPHLSLPLIFESYCCLLSTYTISLGDVIVDITVTSLLSLHTVYLWPTVLLKMIGERNRHPAVVGY